MRIVREIEIEGKEAMALFDSGSFHTYVVKELFHDVPVHLISIAPYKVAIGGREIIVTESCIVRGKIEGLAFHTEATPIDSLGKIDGKPLDAIIGAITMEEWEIKLDPKSDALDLEGLRKRQFVEY